MPPAPPRHRPASCRRASRAATAPQLGSRRYARSWRAWRRGWAARWGPGGWILRTSSEWVLACCVFLWVLGLLACCLWVLGAGWLALWVLAAAEPAASAGALACNLCWGAAVQRPAPSCAACGARHGAVCMPAPPTLSRGCAPACLQAHQGAGVWGHHLLGHRDAAAGDAEPGAGGHHQGQPVSEPLLHSFCPAGAAPLFMCCALRPPRGAQAASWSAGADMPPLPPGAASARRCSRRCARRWRRCLVS